MSTYIAPGIPRCDRCFVCAICDRRVCANAEPVLCACTDDPTCGDCCGEHHGEAS